MKFLIHLSIFNINYECSKMSFMSTFTCHFGHHILSNSNNECSLGSGEGGHLAGEGQTMWNSRENIFKYIFSAVFGKTLEKIYLNIFFLLFLEKRWRKYIQIYFFCCFWKNVGENIFKYIFSAVFGKTLEKIYLNIFFLLFLEKRWRK